MAVIWVCDKKGRPMLQNTRKNEDTKRNHGGFSLIEVMIAMMIFSFGILGLYALQISSVNGNAGARKRTEAVSWAANQMEVLMERPYASIENNQVTEGVYNVQWTAPEIDINNDGTNDGKNIQINVTWTDHRGPKSTTVSFIKLVD
jgi:type IV pilus modification protein PilV